MALIDWPNEEVNRLREENAELRAELERMWLQVNAIPPIANIPDIVDIPTCWREGEVKAETTAYVTVTSDKPVWINARIEENYGD